MLTGAILGAVGSFANQAIGIYRDKEQSKVDQRKRADEIELAKLNAGKDTQVASYQHDSSLQAGISRWVADLRGATRPGLTFFLLGAIATFYFNTDIEGKALIIASTLESTAMAISWWFADRFKK